MEQKKIDGSDIIFEESFAQKIEFEDDIKDHQSNQDDLKKMLKQKVEEKVEISKETEKSVKPQENFEVKIEKSENMDETQNVILDIENVPPTEIKTEGDENKANHTNIVNEKITKKGKVAKNINNNIVEESDNTEEGFLGDQPCKFCNKNHKQELLLLCDKCDNGWHTFCLKPVLKHIPEGYLFCIYSQYSMILIFIS